ncbi:MAG: ABC transporter permease [[Clostridium] fimetarium]|nr:ABC transporter permease [Alistipes timonensis]MCM1404836.1 ABC transporter permease [[Clostridium] fimetarium]
MGIFASLIKKEALHIVRDRRTMMLTLLMPLALLLLFGFAISTEVNNVKVVVAADRFTGSQRGVIERLRANDYFTFEGVVAPTDVERMLREGRADAAIVMVGREGSTRTQVIVDAANPVMGRSAAAYLNGVAEGVSDAPLITSTLYNPQMKSSYNFVPGIMGMIFILICAIMTSVSIVSEKENGTMNLLLVSPVKPGMVIFGKLVPYFILSCAILAIMLAVAYTLLDIPVSDSAIWVVALSLLYIVLSLSVGLLVSALVDTQVSALVVSAMLFMLPVVMLSGMIFPIENMPLPLQWVSGIIPARWYIAAMRKLMIQQLDPGGIWLESVILLAMTAVVLGVAIAKSGLKRS